jgi:hypothetical protein
MALKLMSKFSGDLKVIKLEMMKKKIFIFLNLIRAEKEK